MTEQLTEQINKAESQSVSAVYRTLYWVVLTLLTLTYVYSITAAIGNFMGIKTIAEALEVGISAFGLIVLIVSLLLPVLVYVLALVLGSTVGYLRRILLLFTGITIVAVWQLNVFHFVSLTQMLRT